MGNTVQGTVVKHPCLLLKKPLKDSQPQEQRSPEPALDSTKFCECAPGTQYLHLPTFLSRETDWPLRWVPPQAWTPPIQLQGVDQISKHVVCVKAVSGLVASEVSGWEGPVSGPTPKLAPWSSSYTKGAGPGLAEWGSLYQLSVPNKTTLLAKGNAGLWAFSAVFTEVWGP